jgi:hypothetical protein
MFHKLYLSAHLSDYDIVLIAEYQPEPGPAACSPHGCRAIFGHGALLMGKSEYFELKLQQPLGRARTASGKPRLFVQVRASQLDSQVRPAKRPPLSAGSLPPALQLDPALWDAFEQRLLYHIYHDELPGALGLSDVLQLAQLADRFQVGRREACLAAGPCAWRALVIPAERPSSRVSLRPHLRALLQVPGCLDACNQRIQGAAADDVSWADLHAFYSMPDTLRTGVLKQAGKVFAAKLTAAYVRLEEAWRDDALRRQFCELPLGAVKALAALDELQVVSENTVATALATWLAHDLPGRHAVGKQLLGHIRLHHLSQCYVSEVLPHLPGLGQHLTVQQLLGVVQHEKVTDAANRGRIEALAAVKAPRAQPSSTGLAFEWRVSTAGLLRLAQQALQPKPSWGRVEGDLHRYNGFALRPVADTALNKTNKPYLYVHLEVAVPPELSKQPSDIASSSVLVSGTVQVPGAQAGQVVSLGLDWSLQAYRSKRWAYVWQLQLGEVAVHDMGTLVAALTGKGRWIKSVAAPAPAARVAQLGELPLVFNVTACV